MQTALTARAALPALFAGALGALFLGWIAFSTQGPIVSATSPSLTGYELIVGQSKALADQGVDLKFDGFSAEQLSLQGPLWVGAALALTGLIVSLAMRNAKGLLLALSLGALASFGAGYFLTDGALQRAISDARTEKIDKQDVPDEWRDFARQFASDDEIDRAVGRLRTGAKEFVETQEVRVAPQLGFWLAMGLLGAAAALSGWMMARRGREASAGAA